MRCGYVQRNIVIFLENQLPPDIADKIESHLSWCKHCSDVAKKVEEVRLPIKDSLAVASIPSDRIVKRVMDRIENLPQESRVVPERRYAVVTVVVIVIVYIVARLLKWI